MDQTQAFSNLKKENEWLKLQIESLQNEKYYYLRILQENFPEFTISETLNHEIRSDEPDNFKTTA